MTKYQEFLKAINVISEESFNEVINSLPEVEIESIDFEYDDTQDDIARQIINYLLSKFDYVYVDDIDFAEKTVDIDDVDSLDDLKEIVSMFPKWTIANYDELLEDMQERDQESEVTSLLDEIKLNANLNQLKEFVKTLHNEK